MIVLQRRWPQLAFQDFYLEMLAGNGGAGAHDFNVVGRSPPKMDILRLTARRGDEQTTVFPRSSFGPKPFARSASLVGHAT